MCFHRHTRPTSRLAQGDTCWRKHTNSAPCSQTLSRCCLDTVHWLSGLHHSSKSCLSCVRRISAQSFPSAVVFVRPLTTSRNSILLNCLSGSAICFSLVSSNSHFHGPSSTDDTCAPCMSHSDSELFSRMLKQWLKKRDQGRGGNQTGKHHGNQESPI